MFTCLEYLGHIALTLSLYMKIQYMEDQHEMWLSLDILLLRACPPPQIKVEKKSLPPQLGM